MGRSWAPYGSSSSNESPSWIHAKLERVESCPRTRKVVMDARGDNAERKVRVAARSDIPSV